MKAPTGAGKTIILIDYVDKFLTNVSNNMAFIWLCPGKGNLEEQSRNKMCKFVPGRVTQNLFEALSGGFVPGSTTFINVPGPFVEAQAAIKAFLTAYEQQATPDEISLAMAEAVFALYPVGAAQEVK